MKKWSPICFFLSAITSVSLCVSAHPLDRPGRWPNVMSTTGITFESSHITATGPQRDKGSDIIFHGYQGINCLFAAPWSGPAEHAVYFSFSHENSGEPVNINDAESEVSDHLLHLFPSHYFW